MIYPPAGPTPPGNWKGKVPGSGSDAWTTGTKVVLEQFGKGLDRCRAGIARSYGTCMTTGTASTMTAIAEAIGMTPPGASSIPAADATIFRMSLDCGRRIVEMVWEDLTPNNPDR